MRMDAHMVHLKILFYLIWKYSLMYFVVDRGWLAPELEWGHFIKKGVLKIRVGLKVLWDIAFGKILG